MPHPYGLDATDQALLAGPVARAREAAAAGAAESDAAARFPEKAIATLAKEGLLGLCIPQSHGGLGRGPGAFAATAEELAQACGSTAMVFVMHVAAAQAIAAAPAVAGKDDLLKAIAAGKHLTTLAFSEKGSRSQFWAPVSRLVEKGDGWVTDANKSWVTSAAKADSYVASAQAPKAASPLESTVYLVRKGAAGVRVTGTFQGLGLRGNDSAPVALEKHAVAKGDLLSALGKGADVMLQVVLPWFNVGTAGMANGLCRAAVATTSKHLADTGFEHTGGLLRDLPTLRARLATMSVTTEQARALLGRTIASMMAPDAETMLLVLETRRASLDAAMVVTDLGMKSCGGAAFSKHLALERVFRDARAGWVMAPTVDHLDEFVGRALTGMPLF